MPRQRKERATKRKDGRFVCRYKGQYFYSDDPDGCLLQREEFKRLEKRGNVMSYFVREYALQWFDRTYPKNNTTKAGP